MKLCTLYRDNGHEGVGLVTDHGVIDVAAASESSGIPAPITMLDVIQGGDLAIQQLQQIQKAATAAIDESVVRFAPVIPHPGKILCVGLNYRKHALESNMPIPSAPVYFAKFANSLAAHRESIQLPAVVEQCDYEVELVAVIGRKTRNVNPQQALASVFGYAVGNDLSARDLQFRSSQWLYGKAIDGFSPLGPYLVTADDIADPQDLPLKCWVNGELRQDSTTADMIFSVADVISDLSRIMTLEPGDVIYTGTPEGVAMGMAEKVWLRPGDEIVCEVGHLGRLQNRIV
ncbi:fumarylacetoacetate hydrolase family protein [Alicyclobacillus acidiphilus]|uniref:fumarylacetoacetate hydrolase family protein n=1 Tax=Alicyclobacillus acidiphilus TaxID=182455 RepID=UPI00082D0D4D|nr:fumarylacetoacetate hydrolase family protein [Alicyclobacillus acidiphilus]